MFGCLSFVRISETEMSKKIKNKNKIYRYKRKIGKRKKKKEERRKKKEETESRRHKEPKKGFAGAGVLYVDTNFRECRSLKFHSGPKHSCFFDRHDYSSSLSIPLSFPHLSEGSGSHALYGLQVLGDHFQVVVGERQRSRTFYKWMCAASLLFTCCYWCCCCYCFCWCWCRSCCCFSWSCRRSHCCFWSCGFSDLREYQQTNNKARAGREGGRRRRKKRRKGGHNLWAGNIILLEGNEARDRFLLRDSAQGGDFMFHQWAHLYILNESNNHTNTKPKKNEHANKRETPTLEAKATLKWRELKMNTHLVIHTEGSNPFRREYRVLHTSRTQFLFRIPSICQTEHQKKARANNKWRVKYAKRNK